MRPQSAKAKGRRLQQWVRDTLLKYAPNLLPDDIRSTSMGAGGEDVLLSPAARKEYPFSVECKNVEKLNIYEALLQAEKNAPSFVSNVNTLTKVITFAKAIPIVVFKKNNSKTYVALEFEAFLKLTGKRND